MVVVSAVVVTVAVVAAVLGAGALHDRRRFARRSDTFRCRVLGLNGHEPARRWSRLRTARWVHDVLLVRSGVFRPRLAVVPARLVTGTVPQDADRTQIRRLGRRPVLVHLVADDGRLLDLAAAGADRTLLVGPFLAAEVAGRLPRAPRERGG